MKIEDIIRDELELDSSVKIEDDTSLSKDLRAVEIDILQMFDVLKIPYRKYTSGGNINPEGRERLQNFKNSFTGRVDEGRLRHLGELADAKDIYEFARRLTVKDIKDLAAYK